MNPIWTRHPNRRLTLRWVHRKMESPTRPPDSAYNAGNRADESKSSNKPRSRPGPMPPKRGGFPARLLKPQSPFLAPGPDYKAGSSEEGVPFNHNKRGSPYKYRAAAAVLLKQSSNKPCSRPAPVPTNRVSLPARPLEPNGRYSAIVT